MGSLVRYRAGYRSVNLLPNLACGGGVGSVAHFQAAVNLARCWVGGL